MAQTIGERYELLTRLGVGTIATVFRAKDREQQREVAVKVFIRKEDNDIAAKLCFFDEVEAIRSVAHANIVEIFGHSPPDAEAPYIAMDLVEGGNIDQVLLVKHPLPEQVIISVAYGVAEALHSAHEAGVLHRNLKPSNVLLEDRGRVVLTDFGIAAKPGTPRSGIGAREFLAPEQLNDGEVGDHSDIFSFGSLVYCLATNKSPFAATDAADVEKRVAAAEYPGLKSIRRDLSDDLAGLVAACLKAEPDQRLVAADLASRCEEVLFKEKRGSPRRNLKKYLTDNPPPARQEKAADEPIAASELPRRGQAEADVEELDEWATRITTIATLQALQAEKDAKEKEARQAAELPESEPAEPQPHDEEELPDLSTYQQKLGEGDAPDLKGDTDRTPALKGDTDRTSALGTEADDSMPDLGDIIGQPPAPSQPPPSPGLDNLQQWQEATDRERGDTDKTDKEAQAAKARAMAAGAFADRGLTIRTNKIPEVARAQQEAAKQDAEPAVAPKRARLGASPDKPPPATSPETTPEEELPRTEIAATGRGRPAAQAGPSDDAVEPTMIDLRPDPEVPRTLIAPARDETGAPPKQPEKMPSGPLKPTPVPGAPPTASLLDKIPSRGGETIKFDPALMASPSPALPVPPSPDTREDTDRVTRGVPVATLPEPPGPEVLSAAQRAPAPPAPGPSVKKPPIAIMVAAFSSVLALVLMIVLLAGGRAKDEDTEAPPPSEPETVSTAPAPIPLVPTPSAAKPPAPTPPPAPPSPPVAGVTPVSEPSPRPAPAPAPAPAYDPRPTYDPRNGGPMETATKASKPKPKPKPKRRPKPTGPGKVEILVRPWGKVSIDGKTRGNTPMIRLVELPPGRHTISVSNPKLGTQTKTVTIRSGRKSTIKFDLR